jgi:4-hydroxybenzoate polyprenyltransferase
LAPRPSTPVLLLRGLRPHQWIKNVLLFAGLFFTRLFLHPASILRALAAFALFCAASGAIYLLNDILDAPRDRLNPRKRHRPIATGELSPAAAGGAAAALMIAVVAGGYSLSLPFGMCASAYLAMMIGYCTLLKNVFLVDALIIAMGFVIRAIAGVIALRTPDQQAPLTTWFVVCIIFLSLFLALSKRRSELMRLDKDAAAFRPVLALYTTTLLDQLVSLCATAAVLSYTLYATSLAEPWMMLSTLPFVIYGLFRYMYLVDSLGSGDAPEDVLMKDGPLLGCVLLWLAALGFVYLPKG